MVVVIEKHNTILVVDNALFIHRERAFEQGTEFHCFKRLHKMLYRSVYGYSLAKST